jgi:DNA polymerase III subunit epsilon
MPKYLVIDLEMTGDDPGWHEIIQIGAVMFDDNWNKLGTFLSNVYPENEESFSIPSAAVHGLTLEILEDAPMIYDVIESFEKWACDTAMGHNKWKEDQKAGILKNIVLCGQSVYHDINFLRYAYRSEHQDWPFSYKNIDLYQLSLFLFKILEANGKTVPKSLSLGAVAEYFGFERAEDTHNALEDSELTGKCLKKVLGFAERLKLQ